MKKVKCFGKKTALAGLLWVTTGLCLPAIAAAAPGEPIGAPILMTTNLVDTLAIGRAYDGHIVVVDAESCDASAPCSQQLMARRYSASGVAIGAPIIVTTTSGADGFSYGDIHIATNADGGFAVTWMLSHFQSKAEAFLSLYGPLSVHLRSFSASGEPLSGDITVARDVPPSNLSASAIAIDDAGNAVVVVGRGTHRTFLSTNHGLSPLLVTNTETIAAHRYSADGSQLMRPATVASGLSLMKYGDTIHFSWGNKIQGLSAASDGPGNFVVGWVDRGVKIRRYAASGTAQGKAENISGDSSASGAVALAMNRGGRLAVLWSGCEGSCVRSYLPGGAQDGGVASIPDDGGLNISIDAAGDLALAQDFRSDNSAGVHVRSLMPDGTARHSVYELGLPDVSSLVAASVASDAVGNYAVAYAALVPFDYREQYPANTYLQLFEGP